MQARSAEDKRVFVTWLPSCPHPRSLPGFLLVLLPHQDRIGRCADSPHLQSAEEYSEEYSLFDLMENDLAVLRQGLHPTRSTSGSVEEILKLWEHRVVKTKRTEVSGAPGRQGRKVVCQQYQLLLYLRNRSF